MRLSGSLKCDAIENLPVGQLPRIPAVSMGRRNTRPKSYPQVFQWLNSFASVDSRKTLPCLGLIEYGLRDRVL